MKICAVCEKRFMGLGNHAVRHYPNPRNIQDVCCCSTACAVKCIDKALWDEVAQIQESKT